MTQYIMIINLVSDQDVIPQQAQLFSYFKNAKKAALKAIYHDLQTITAHPKPDDPVYKIHEHNLEHQCYRCDLTSTSRFNLASINKYPPLVDGLPLVIENALVMPVK